MAGNGNGSAIRHTIFAPCLPGAHFAIMERALQLGKADWVLAPFDGMADDEVLFEGFLECTKKYVGLHGVETLHILFRDGFGSLAGRIYDRLRDYGASQDTQVEVEMKKVNIMKVEPTALVFVCGDGRPEFRDSRARIFQRYVFPKMITPPGGGLWMRDHPEFASHLQAWIDSQPKIPRVEAKHATCGYRGHQGPCEMEAALLECTRDDTEYIWQPGVDSRIEMLRPRAS